jgi:hypothetical protein
VRRDIVGARYSKLCFQRLASGLTAPSPATPTTGLPRVRVLTYGVKDEVAGWRTQEVEAETVLNNRVSEFKETSYRSQASTPTAPDFRMAIAAEARAMPNWSISGLLTNFRQDFARWCV